MVGWLGGTGGKRVGGRGETRSEKRGSRTGSGMLCRIVDKDRGPTTTCEGLSPTVLRELATGVRLVSCHTLCSFPEAWKHRCWRAGSRLPSTVAD